MFESVFAAAEGVSPEPQGGCPDKRRYGGKLPMVIAGRSLRRSKPSLRGLQASASVGCGLRDSMSRMRLKTELLR